MRVGGARRTRPPLRADFAATFLRLYSLRGASSGARARREARKQLITELSALRGWLGSLVRPVKVVKTGCNFADERPQFLQR